MLLNAVLMAALMLTAAAVAFAGPTPVKRKHPYLFFSKSDIPALKKRLKHPEIARMWERVRKTASRLKGSERGRQANPVLCAGIAYQLTGDRKLAAGAIKTLMKIAGGRGPWHRRPHGSPPS